MTAMAQKHPERMSTDFSGFKSTKPVALAPSPNNGVREIDDRRYEETRSFQLLKAWCERERAQE